MVKNLSEKKFSSRIFLDLGPVMKYKKKFELNSEKFENSNFFQRGFRPCSIDWWIQISPKKLSDIGLFLIVESPHSQNNILNKLLTQWTQFRFVRLKILNIKSHYNLYKNFLKLYFRIRRDRWQTTFPRNHTCQIKKILEIFHETIKYICMFLIKWTDDARNVEHAYTV